MQSLFYCSYDSRCLECHRDVQQDGQGARNLSRFNPQSAGVQLPLFFKHQKHFIHVNLTHCVTDVLAFRKKIEIKIHAMFDQFVGLTLNTLSLFEIADTYSPDLFNFQEFSSFFSWIHPLFRDLLPM